MKRLFLLPFFALSLPWAQTPAQDGRAAAIGAQLRTEGFDRQQCYRVRDLALVRDEVRLYFTDGYLMLAKPINGRRTAAVFIADEEGDAEVLVMPPLRSERLSLANFNGGVPTLSQHFRDALLVFTDDTADEFLAHITKTKARNSPETGTLIASNWDETLKNLYSSFSVRLAQDLLDPEPQLGFAFAALALKSVGALDVMVDPRAAQQITVGRLTVRNDRLFYDVWCHFSGRSWRTGQRAVAQPEFKLSNYRIDASVDQNLRVSVTTRVELTPATPLAALAFEISPQMRVTEAKVDGQPSEVYLRESLRATLLRGSVNETFLVVPPGKLQTGRKYELEFRHEGDVVSDAGNGVYYVGSRGTWYPNRDLQFADYDFIFRYPRGVTLVGTGELVDERTEGDIHIVHRKTTGPIRLAGFNLGDYQKFTAREGGLAVDVYANRRVEAAIAKQRSVVILPPNTSWPRRPLTEVLPLAPAPGPDPTAHCQALANEIVSAFDFYAHRFGPPPMSRLTVSPIPGRFGQGFPGLIYLSTLSYLKPQDRPNVTSSATQQFFSDLLHAHEVSHQWWGNVVTTDGYQDGWLMEGLANYSALMYLEKKKGTRAMEETLDEYKKQLLSKKEDGKTIESVGPITWGLRLESSQAPTAWLTVTYLKGAWIYHMLRRQLGDAGFNELLAALMKRYRFQAITVTQLQALAAEFLPKGSPDPKLEAFFDNWVYDVGIPTLKLTYSVKGKAPNVVVTGTVNQSDVDEHFSAWVPVEITTARGKTVKWVATGEGAPFTVKLALAPSKVALDPGASILAVRK